MLCVVITSNIALLKAPGNVLVPVGSAGLPKDSVANVAQVITLDRDYLLERAGQLPLEILAEVDAGLKLVLGI